MPVHDMTINGGERAVTLCANPACGKPLDSVRVRVHGAKTCDDRCRAAAWKVAHSYGRHDPPQRRANGKPSGLQISYRKAVAVFEAYLKGAGAPHAEEIASELMRGALSARQRQQLEDRQHEGSSST